MSAALPAPSAEALAAAGEALRLARRGALALALACGGFVGWAAFAPLDQGLAAEGTVAVAGERKAVQSLTGGTVERILVREGERVARGQLLVQLNTIEAEARRDGVRERWLAARTSEARLGAERSGSARITWPADLAALAEMPAAREAMKLQQDLFATRRRELANREKILSHAAAALRDQLAGLREIASRTAEQLALAREEHAGLQRLFDEGYLARNRLIAAERGIAQLGADRAATLAELGRIEEALHGNALEAEQARASHRREAETQLAALATEVATLGEQLAALDFEVERGGVVAPVDGQVMGLSVHTEGGVVAPLQLLMEIVPVGARWLVKAEFEPSLAERLAPGLPVDVRFAVLERARTPVVPGRVATVSPDQRIDPHTGAAHFVATIEPEPAAHEALRKAGLEVKPGMQTLVLVRTGERTLASYLLKPLTERFAAALNEE